jgi:hypothetical protein
VKRFAFLVLLICALFPLLASAQEPSTDDFAIDLHGYFRTRLINTHGFPMQDITSVDENGVLRKTPDGLDDGANLSYGYMRFRLDPTIRFGNAANPVFAIKSQIDFLDNVVFGDNSRQGSVPLFAEDPSTTDIFGRDQSFVKIRRLWLEFNALVGQIRIGRQPSHGGMGLLFNDGNGFRNDFGDAERGSTFDRIAFITRPITVFNAITKKDSRPTPLIFLLAYDWLVEDPLGVARQPKAATDRNVDKGFGGFLRNSSCPDPDNNFELKTCDDDVSQFVTGLIWLDPDLDIFSHTDEVSAGYIFVWRFQDVSDSDVYIHDAWLRFQMAMGYNMPSIYLDTEMTMIKGSSRGISLIGGYDDAAGKTAKTLTADVFNMVGRLGVKDINASAVELDIIGEMGHSSGDPTLLGEETFKMFAINEDYKVGLIMYPIALTGRSFNAAGGISSALTNGGGVWNSTYIFPHFRLRPTGTFKNIELVGAVLLAWADTLNGGVWLTGETGYFAERTDPLDNECSLFQGDCALGTEFDLALKVKWLRRDSLNEARDVDNYMMRWSTEFGYMKAGKALAPKLDTESIWTLQSRIAVVF